MGPMEIRDFSTLVNKCRLVEDCNLKLAAAKASCGNFKKGLAPQGPTFKPNFQQQKKFQPMGNKDKQPRGLFRSRHAQNAARIMMIGRAWQDKMFVLDVASQVTKFTNARPGTHYKPPSLSVKEGSSPWM